jgi:hypothetical protein
MKTTNITPADFVASCKANGLTIHKSQCAEPPRVVDASALTALTPHITPAEFMAYAKAHGFNVLKTKTRALSRVAVLTQELVSAPVSVQAAYLAKRPTTAIKRTLAETYENNAASILNGDKPLSKQLPLVLQSYGISCTALELSDHFAASSIAGGASSNLPVLQNELIAWVNEQPTQWKTAKTGGLTGREKANAALVKKGYGLVDAHCIQLQSVGDCATIGLRNLSAPEAHVVCVIAMDKDMSARYIPLTHGVLGAITLVNDISQILANIEARKAAKLEASTKQAELETAKLESVSV